MRYSGREDAWSIGISFICLLHCIIFPLFLTSIPFLGFEVLENVYVELLTILLAAIVGGYAIKKGYFNFHKNKNIVILFVAGISLMLFSNFLLHSAEVWLKLAGGLVLTAAHIQNFKFSQKSLVKLNVSSGTGFVNNIHS